MNPLGRCSIVLVFAAGLAFGWLAAPARAQESLERELSALRAELEKVHADNQELKECLHKLRADLAAQKSARDRAFAELKAEREALKRELAKREHEVGELRKQTQHAQTQRDKYFKQVVQMTDQLHLRASEIQRLRARNLALAAELAKVSGAGMTKSGGALAPWVVEYPPQHAPVEGIVTTVHPKGLVEISIGSDDGLLKGHRLDVYRIAGGKAKYLGRIEVLKTAPDKAACKVLPQFSKGPIQRGDRVATKIE